jgi:DNA-binding GntR family transcriptional regulator
MISDKALSASHPKIERRPLGEQVFGLVRRMISEGELKPGERLVEEHLASRIGTSRTPIREALHRLVQEGLVERRRRGGYVVRPISTQEVEEVTGVRAALEAYAVELGSRRISETTLAELERNVADFEKALAKGNQKRLVELNTQFHNMVYHLAGSKLLVRLINDLAETLHRFRVSLLSDPKAAKRSLEDHREMLAALKRGDQEQAVRVCRAHILAGGAWILDQLKEQDTEEN